MKVAGVPWTIEQRARMCGKKKRFGGQLSAEAFRQSIMEKDPTMAEQRPYQCPICRFWHLGHANKPERTQ